MDDRVRVAQLLGREPRGAFDVVVRDDSGDPIVVRNAPLLDDGTPMPTRYYLVGAELVRNVSRLEADGGVRRAEAEVDPTAIAATHQRYAAERDAAVAPDHQGPRPYGGVGGTRTGVKCLHAHVAYTLAGGDDPVGRWALAHLGTTDPTTGTFIGTTDPTADLPAGTLTVRLDDRSTDVMIDGVRITLPIGPLTLLEGPLERADPPSPAHLTNALGLVADHLDDIIIAAPSVATVPSVIVVGSHAEAMARVEIGDSQIPAGYRLRRSDADEVFRTLATEPVVDRRHNPGLDESHVESIIATCCMILGVMRRLDLDSIGVTAANPHHPHASDRQEAT